MSKVSVAQFVEINRVLNKSYETEIERDIAIMSILSGKPEDYFERLTLRELRESREAIAIPDINKVSAPKKYLRAGKRTYAPVFMFNELTASQYIDATSFIKGADIDANIIIESLPEILASICVPTRRSLTGRKRLKYLAINHKTVAEDMRSADIMESYAIAVFFSNVLITFLKVTGDYLALKMIEGKAATKTTLSKAEKAALSTIIAKLGVGTISQDGSQTSTA
jgi:hypothetical protein